MSQMMVVIEMKSSYNLTPKVVDFIKSNGFDIQHTQLATWIGEDGEYQTYKHVWMEDATGRDVNGLLGIFKGCARISDWGDGCLLIEIDDDWDK